MEQSTAQRRIVKSPPELWAEVSSEDILGRHLAEFGEIRITRADPETTVAWEGDRASGTVELTPEGWGTKVVLTATPEAPPAPEPVAAEPEPEPVPPPTVFRSTPVRIAPREPEARRGFFARLFDRDAEPAAEIPTPGPPPADPSPPTPTPDPTPPAPGPAPTPPPSPTPPIDPVPPGGPDPGPTPPSIELDPARTVAILTEVLDDLGAAHHRPFSRG
jgi:hypothetical protein